MLKQSVDPNEKLDILETGCQIGEEDQPIYLLLSFINQELFVQHEKPLSDSCLKWFTDAFTVIMDVVNCGVDHMLVSETIEICSEFLNHTLENLVEMSEHTQGTAVRLVGRMGSNKSLGKQVIVFSLQRFIDTAECYRTALMYRCEDSVIDTFTVYCSLLTDMWPEYVNVVSPPSLGRLGGRKDKSNRPRLSLGETSELAEEITQWRKLLDECTVGLTVFRPHFCDALWRVDHFFQGLLSSLTHMRVS